MEPKEDTSLKIKGRQDLELSGLSKENSKSDSKAMRHRTVRRIVDWFRSSSSPEEETPFANKLRDNGSIGRNQKMENGKNISESSMPDDDFSDKPKMGILRKLLFVLSLNGGVAYMAVLLWAIPCRHPLCLQQQQQEWQRNLTALLTSNMETTNFSGELQSIVFGYSDGNGGHLASIALSDGKMIWNQNLPHKFRHVFCQFNNSLEFNKMHLCIATAYNFIGAFDASNGKMAWQQNISNPYGETIHKVSVSKNRDMTFIFGISDSYLFVLNAKNGSLMSTIALPCSWTVDMKLIGPMPTGNETIWTLICEYGDSVEIRTFREEELLNSSEENLRDDVEFSLSSSRDTGSIDLAGDVTTTPDSLALSWAHIVVMVTAQAPFHHLQRTWERRFFGLLKDYLPVTSLVFGHFTDPKKNEIAVTVQDGINMTMHILDTKNGSSVAITDLGVGSVMAMKRIPAEKDKTDTLVIESMHNAAEKVNSSNQPSEQTTRSYFTMRYIGKSAIYQTLISSEVYASTLSQFSKTSADLITASKTPDGQTSLRRLIINSDPPGPPCDSNNQRNTSTVLILN